MPTTEQMSSFRSSLSNLAHALDIPLPRIAEHGVMPKGIVLELADLLQVQLSNGTAEEQLTELIELTGLVDSRGNSLSFPPNSSGHLADEIACQVSKIKQLETIERQRRRPSQLTLAETSDTGARTKLEAVNRISNLTNSGPETLGPGSKERKSVLTNLFRGLNLGEPPATTKSDLGSLIAENLGVEWDHRCHSTGETITLEGLSRLLLAATSALTGNERQIYSTKSEAEMYAGSILQSIIDTASVEPDSGIPEWDGRSAVEEMVAKTFSNARQTEWPGWFFEFKALPDLKKKYGGGPVKFGSTTFDYRGKHTWDMKVHSETPGKNRVILNDMDSIKLAVEQDGLGFIILRGVPSFNNEEDFYFWHNHILRGKPQSPRSASSRKLKTAFSPRVLEFYFVDSYADLNRLESTGVLSEFKQGRQQSGAPRKVKYQMNLDKAHRSDALVYSIDISSYISDLEV